MTRELPWARPLLFSVGKGGVGRSSVALAAAVALGARGRRVALVEVHGARSLALLARVSPRGARPVPIAAGVDLLSLDTPACLRAYASDRRALAPLAGAVLGARVIRAFLDAVPGMGDLLHLGLLHSLLAGSHRRGPLYDAVVVDAPPTGHGLALTATARAMAEMTLQGPIHTEALQIAERLDDPAHTGQLLVTRPDELPVQEALELLAALGPQRPTVRLVLANRTWTDRLAEVPWPRLRSAVAQVGGTEALCAAGDRLEARLAVQRAALGRLRPGVGDVPVWLLPELDPPPGGPDDPRLSDALVAGGAP